MAKAVDCPIAATEQVVFEMFEAFTPKETYSKAKSARNSFAATVAEVFGKDAALVHAPKDSDGKLWAVGRVSRNQTLGVLAKSGVRGVFVRPFVPKGQDSSHDLVQVGKDVSLAKALEAAKKVQGHLGLAITRRGISSRVDVSKLAEARMVLGGETGAASGVVERALS